MNGEGRQNCVGFLSSRIERDRLQIRRFVQALSQCHPIFDRAIFLGTLCLNFLLTLDRLVVFKAGGRQMLLSSNEPGMAAHILLDSRAPG